MGCPACLTTILYSPVEVGVYVMVAEPSLLSLHFISAFEGPSMAKDKPPDGDDDDDDDDDDDNDYDDDDDGGGGGDDDDEEEEE